MIKSIRHFFNRIRITHRGMLLSLQRQKKQNIFNSQDRVRILCIGDSHTWGFGSSSDESYPSQLEMLINSSGKRKCQVINAGIPGMNSAMIAEELVKKVNVYAPDIVIVNGGSNNCWNRTSLSKHYNTNKGQTFGGQKIKENIFSFIYNMRIYKLVNILIINHRKSRYSCKPVIVYPNLAKDKNGNLFADTVIMQDGSFKEIIKYEGHPDNPIPWENEKWSYVENYKRFLNMCYVEMMQFLDRKKYH